MAFKRLLFTVDLNGRGLLWLETPTPSLCYFDDSLVGDVGRAMSAKTISPLAQLEPCREAATMVLYFLEHLRWT